MLSQVKKREAIMRILQRDFTEAVTQDTVDDILQACETHEITDEDVCEAWDAYARHHFRLHGAIPTELEASGMRAALERVLNV